MEVVLKLMVKVGCEMEKKNIVMTSYYDDLPIDVTIFIPDDTIKGIFQISHGMSEHKERYYDFMEFLSNNGYVTIINDHRGHGKSIRKKEDLGYLYDDTSNSIVSDLHQVTEYIKMEYPDKNITLFGHSMGSMVVRKYIKKYDSEIDKLIVCGSPSKNPHINSALILTKLVKAFRGDRHRSVLIQKLAFGSFNNNFKNVSSVNSWICSDEEEVKKYDDDQLSGFIFTINGFENLFRLMKDIYSKKGWELNNKKLPIFFIAGSFDPVIISKDKWMESQEFLKELGYKNIKNKLYENMRHEILNENGKNQVYNDILKFIGE